MNQKTKYSIINLLISILIIVFVALYVHFTTEKFDNVSTTDNTIVNKLKYDGNMTFPFLNDENNNLSIKNYRTNDTNKQFFITAQRINGKYINI